MEINLLHSVMSNLLFRIGYFLKRSSQTFVYLQEFKTEKRKLKPISLTKKALQLTNSHINIINLFYLKETFLLYPHIILTDV